MKCLRQTNHSSKKPQKRRHICQRGQYIQPGFKTRYLHQRLFLQSLFNIIPMVTPITATMMNVLLCLAGGVLLGGGLGFGSKAVLDRFDIL